MKNVVIAILGVLAALIVWGAEPSFPKSEWPGVDEAVIGKFAREANRTSQEPIINVEGGDLLLFLFLLAGAGGGFLGGYYFRELFPPNPKNGIDKTLESEKKRT